MNSARDTLSGGLPHSEIPGSPIARISPGLFAACRVLHRLSVPRHPPDALVLLGSTPKGGAGTKPPRHRHRAAGPPEGEPAARSAAPSAKPRRPPGANPKRVDPKHPRAATPRRSLSLKTLSGPGTAAGLTPARRPVRLGHIRKLASPVSISTARDPPGNTCRRPARRQHRHKPNAVGGAPPADQR